MITAEAPNVADWIAAIGQAAGAIFTAGAVGVAVWLGWRDRKWRRDDQATAAAEIADRDAAQARLVTIKPLYDQYEWNLDVILVRVHNGSESPIFDLEVVQLSSDSAETSGWRIEFGPYDDEPYLAVVLTANETFGLPVVFLADEGKRTTFPHDGEQYITVRFTDAAGLRWTRTNNSPPRRLIESH